MEFEFLGTSSGVPTRFRNVSALVIKRQNEKTWCLVDCGEGTQHQLLHTPHSLTHLDTVLITHVHGDHCYGLPGLLATASMAGRKQPLKIVAPFGVEEFVRNTVRYTDMFLGYDFQFIRAETMKNLPIGNEFTVDAIELSHRVPSYAYSFTEVFQQRTLDKTKLMESGIAPGPAWGELAHGRDVTTDDGHSLRAQDFCMPSPKARKIIVSGDNDTPQLLTHEAQTADVVVHEATYTQDVADTVGPIPQHSSAKAVAEFAQSIDLPNLILTHFSARYHHTEHAGSAPISDIEHEAKKYYSGNLYLARDFLHFVLDRNGELRLTS